MGKFKAVYKGDLRCEAIHLASNAVIFSDAPVDNHGKGANFSPTDLTTTSVALCMLTIMGIKAQEKNIDLKGTTVSIEKIMVTNPRRIGTINLVFDLSTNLPISDTDKEILERSAHHCPVKKSLHPDIIVNTTFNW